MKKILVVDDDVQATNLLAAILSHHGYEVISVNDSTLALQKAGQLSPDMILLDLMMPVIDGFKICRMLREDRKFLFTPIIIITALNDEDSKVIAYGCGADEYITKPYLPANLLTLIKDQFEMGTEV